MNNVLEFPSKAPAEVVFLPEGVHAIHANTNGAAKRSTVRITAARGPAIAAKLNQDLVRRQSQNVRPWVDFGHAEGAAAALPKAFRYEPGKGVVLAVEWTDAGRRAIEGKDWSYFSPVFYLGDDGEPDGLPAKGPVGALVNEPAFRTIPRIAASDASHSYLDRARSLVAAGDVPEIHAGCAKVFEADPTAYSQYLGSLRTGKGAVELIEAEDFTGQTGADLVKAIADRIEDRGREAIAAGEASNLSDGIAVALSRNPALYTSFLVAAADVRPEVLAEIEAMRQAREPSPKQVLDELAAKLLAGGEATSEDDARIMALERRPDLYQQMMDTAAELLGD